MSQPAIIPIVVRRGTLAEWTAANPVLLEGEIGVITELVGGAYVPQHFVIGDGVNDFITLYTSANSIYYPGINATGDMLKSIYDTNDNTAVDIAETLRIEVKNATGSTVTKGSIVYIKSTSSSANHPEILLASAATEATSSKTIGAVYDDIADGELGWVVLKGEVYNADTNAYNVGDKLWLSNTPGQVTLTRPTQPNHSVFIGHVTRKQSNNGRIVYTIYNGYELDELHDVLIEGIQNGQIIQWDSVAGLWKNKPYNQWHTDYDGQITGDRDGVNANFTLSFNCVDTSLKVYLNGLRVTPGAGYDYTLTAANTIRFNYPPDRDSILLAEYLKQ